MAIAQEAVDSDGFTAAERAYFASGGAKTEGLVDGVDEFTPETPEPAPTPESAAATPQSAAQPDANADPFDELEKVARDNRGKTGKLIPEANFRAVSEKYKLTKSQRDQLQQRVDQIEADAKTAREELQREREMRARIDERLKLFNEVIAPQAAPQEKKAPPNPEEDIFGYVKWLEESHKQEIEALKGQIGQTTETIQSRDAETSLRSTYQQDAIRFAQQTPDFGAAYNHVNRVRDAMLESIGYADPNERARIRMDEERALVEQALRANKSPAEVIYGVAKSLGYTKAAPAAPAAPAHTPATQAAPNVTEEIERIQKAQAASKSLSSAGGAAPGPMTVEQLANMTDSEFEAYARKNPAVVQKLMGG